MAFSINFDNQPTADLRESFSTIVDARKPRQSRSSRLPRVAHFFRDSDPCGIYRPLAQAGPSRWRLAGAASWKCQLNPPSNLEFKWKRRNLSGTLEALTTTLNLRFPPRLHSARRRSSVATRFIKLPHFRGIIHPIVHKPATFRPMQKPRKTGLVLFSDDGEASCRAGEERCMRNRTLPDHPPRSSSFHVIKTWRDVKYRHKNFYFYVFRK